MDTYMGISMDISMGISMDISMDISIDISMDISMDLSTDISRDTLPGTRLNETQKTRGVEKLKLVRKRKRNSSARR